MSRSAPNNSNPHPCERWFEWNGGKGGVSYYDKTAKGTVDVPFPFVFLHLDETATVRGWHDPSESGIVSNEVRDTRSDVMVVRSFKGGELCHGLYASIRDKVGNLGGHFSTNLYLGFRDSGVLRLGCLQLKGAALNHWVEFKKANLKSLSTEALCIAEMKAGKKGSVNYQTPVFSTKPVSRETNDQAMELDKKLQEHLKAYFARTKTEQAAAPPPAVDDGADTDLAPAPIPTEKTAQMVEDAQGQADEPPF